MLKILLYVLFSAGGLILLKIGTGKNFEFIIGNDYSLSIKLNLILLLGFILYIASFTTSMIIMKETNLNIFYPISAGLIYIIVCVLSYVILHEHMSLIQVIGMGIILIGIIIMNIKK